MGHALLLGFLCSSYILLSFFLRRLLHQLQSLPLLGRLLQRLLSNLLRTFLRHLLCAHRFARHFLRPVSRLGTRSLLLLLLSSSFLSLHDPQLLLRRDFEAACTTMSCLGSRYKLTIFDHLLDRLGNNQSIRDDIRGPCYVLDYSLARGTLLLLQVLDSLSDHGGIG